MEQRHVGNRTASRHRLSVGIRHDRRRRAWSRRSHDDRHYLDLLLTGLRLGGGVLSARDLHPHFALFDADEIGAQGVGSPILSKYFHLRDQRRRCDGFWPEQVVSGRPKKVELNQNGWRPQNLAFESAAGCDPNWYVVRPAGFRRCACSWWLLVGSLAGLRRRLA